MAGQNINIISGVNWRAGFLLLCFWGCGLAYSQSIDSLKSVLQNPANSDSLNGYLHMKIGWLYYPLQENDSAGEFHFRKSLKISNNPRHLGRSAFFMHMLYEHKIDSAEHFFEMAEKQQWKTSDSTYLYHLYSNMSMYYQDAGYFQSAAENMFKALVLAEGMSDSALLAGTYVSLANIFHDFEDFEEGKKYGHYALRVARNLQETKPWLYIDALNIIAINFDDNRQYDSALYYHGLVEKFTLTLDEKISLDRTLNNMGNTLKKMGLVDSSKSYFLRAHNIIKESNSPIISYHEATVFTNLADVSSQQGNKKEAFEYLAKASRAALSSGNYEKIRDLYNMKYLVNKRAGRMDSALVNLEKHLYLRDSVLNDRNARLVKDLEVAYRTEKKEKENAELQAVTAQQSLELSAARNRNILLGAVAGIFLIIGGFGYRNLKLKQMAEKAAAEEELQKIRFQSVIETEERERIRIAKDLHDGLGQILATTKLNVASLEGDQKSGEEEELVSRSMNLLDQSITELRAISHAMMPQVLRNKGLQPAPS